MMLTPDHITKAVARVYDVPVGFVRGPLRHGHIALARAVAMYLCRRCLLGDPDKRTGVQQPLSYAKIGRHFGGRDHSTVHVAVRKVAKMLEVQDYECNDNIIAEIMKQLRPQMGAEEIAYIQGQGVLGKKEVSFNA